MKLLLLLVISFITSNARAVPNLIRDIEFARVGDHSLKLDLHIPETREIKPTLLVYVHGGAWRAGSKNEMPLSHLVAQGFAIASVDYRLSPAAAFPAQVHDIKAAIRFLRAKGREYGLESKNVAIVGSSAGGHLAALVGVSNGVTELEGNVGEYLNESSAVHSVISLYGASNLQTILSQSTPRGLSVRVPALELLLGGSPSDKPELARLASPVAHVDPNDPPLLLIHGDEDPQMPLEQSRELHRAYEAAGLPVQLEVIREGRHGGPEFYDEARTALMARWLEKSQPR